MKFSPKKTTALQQLIEMFESFFTKKAVSWEISWIVKDSCNVTRLSMVCSWKTRNPKSTEAPRKKRSKKKKIVTLSRVCASFACIFFSDAVSKKNKKTWAKKLAKTKMYRLNCKHFTTSFYISSCLAVRVPHDKK